MKKFVPNLRTPAARMGEPPKVERIQVRYGWNDSFALVRKAHRDAMKAVFGDAI